MRNPLDKITKKVDNKAAEGWDKRGRVSLDAIFGSLLHEMSWINQ